MKEELTRAMTELGRDPRLRVIGYGLKYGKAGGTMAGIPESSFIETTVAENLMAGMATGLSIAGYKPLVYFERFDFVLNALDAIVNHLDKLRHISNGEFKPACIFRVVVGNTKKPRFTGPTHTQDFTEALALMVSFPVIRLERAEDVEGVYAFAKKALDVGESTMIVEYKDLLK